ncbi:hypothetical protein [Flavobacterium sp. FlaQc-48]|uniref:hypothetical protein n=1 Tax=Flavobacterium sp. FlaQc-48 TaxID=3374181 RepID=UPI00375716E3
MEIVKIPKKLRDVFDVLRSGQIEQGLEQLSKIKDFEPQKNIAKAEISYFKSNYEDAMTNDENALPFDEQWYAGNVLFEHFFAYTSAAMSTNNTIRAEKFYSNYLTEKEKQGLPEHRINVYRHQVNQHLAKLKGEKNLKIDKNLLKVINEGKPISDFIAQLKEYRPKLTYESSQAAEYLLYFMLEKGNTDESLAYYEKYAENLINQDHHINASRLFVLKGENEKAKKAILNYVKKWYPVEHIQVTPIQIFQFEDLYPILTKEFKNEILETPKAQQ